MKKLILFIAVIIGFAFGVRAQHLFTVSYNGLSSENIVQISAQLNNTEVSTLSLKKNNENKEVYPVAFSSVSDAKIIILNEMTGAHVVITPAAESLTEFQLAPFFIEELRQSVLGEANRYVIMETDLNFSVKSAASVSATRGDVFIPRYFYGKKEDVREALPQDRQIIHIFKMKPRLISASDDVEHQRYIAQLEEEMSYYRYMFKLPNGVLCTYDEHYNPDSEDNVDKLGTQTRVGERLTFVLSGNLNAQQTTATEHAFMLWGAQLSGTIPVDINITATPMGGSTIGASYAQQHFFNPETDTYYHSPLWNQLVGYDATNLRDIRLEMNSQFNFYYGTDGNAGSRTDWVTIMLHEICHGLGFAALTRQDGGYVYTNAGGSGYSTNSPGIFDRQLFQGSTGNIALTDLDQNGRKALIISNNLYAGAPDSHLLAGNGGERVRMHAPTSYQSGSSVSHWHYTSVTFSTWMKYAYVSPLHTFNTRKIGILLDMGWTQPIIDPNASWVTFHANGGTGNMSNQQFLPEQAQELRINGFNRNGYTFINWNTAANGTGTPYENQQSLVLSNDMDLYAQWQANTYTLSFNANSGTVSPTSKQVTFGVPVGELPIPVRADHDFVEWRYGSTVIDAATIWSFTQDMTVSARWNQINNITESQRVASLQVVPNPASHSVELRVKNYELRVDHVEFYNVFGQLVKSVSFAGQTTKDGITQRIDISDLNAGVYMVKAGDKIVKLVVN